MDTKECPFCSEDIRAQAKRCRYCHQWIGRTNRTIRHPAFAVGVFLLVILGFYCFLLRMMQDTLFAEGEKFSDYSDSLVIESDKMASSASEKKVYVVGKAKNVGDIAWKRIQIKADFFDASSELIDTAEDYLSAELRPGKAMSFKAVSCTSQDPAKYADYQVYVLTAEDASTPW